jgi:hypothetical protein
MYIQPPLLPQQQQQQQQQHQSTTCGCWAQGSHETKCSRTFMTCCMCLPSSCWLHQLYGGIYRSSKIITHCCTKAVQSKNN